MCNTSYTIPAKLDTTTHQFGRTQQVTDTRKFSYLGYFPNINHTRSNMVTYTTEALQALVGAKPVGPIDPIHERPTFSSLWHLQQQLVEGLRKVTNTAYPNDGHSGYILSKESFALYSTKEWMEPADVR